MTTVYTTLDYEYRHKNKRNWSDFGAQKVWGVQMRSKKLRDMYSTDEHEVYTRMLILTRTEVTNAMSNVYTTLDYDYRHKKKGTNQVWYSRDVVCGIMS